MTNLPLAQQTSTIAESIARAREIKNTNRWIFWLVVFGFIAFPANPSTALLGLPLLGISIFRRHALKKEDREQAV
jgi:hypothetical protein